MIFFTEMNIQKPESLLSVVIPGELLVSPSSQELLAQVGPIISHIY